ncbi:hypothetical protein KX262_03510 [Escherichia coli]|nr:hypothetical protein [Escherichia coli]
MSTTWFVGADWLAEHIDDPEIQIIDARMASPGQEDRNVARFKTPGAGLSGI